MTSLRSAIVVRFDSSDSTPDWVTHGAMRYRCLFIGGEGDPAAPIGVVVRAGEDVGDRISSTRTHSTAAMTVVIDGTIQYDGRWMKPGDIHIGPADAAHGDLVVGPCGATFFILFAQRSGLVPRFADADDQLRFDAELRDAVERVAKGVAETSVAIFPLRTDYSKRRGIKVLDSTEVAALKRTRSDAPVLG